MTRRFLALSLGTVLLLPLAYWTLLPAEEDPASLRNIGRSFYEEENYPEAVKTFEKLVALVPDSAEDRVNLGIVLVQMERYDDARRELEQARKLSPRLTPYAAYNIGLSYKRQRDFAKSAPEFERVKAADPSDPDTAYNLAVVYENLGQLDKAFEEASRAVQLLPDEIAPRYRRMMIAVRLGRTETANQEKNRLSELRTEDARNRKPAELEMSRYTEIVEPERTRAALPAAAVRPAGVRFVDVTAAAGISGAGAKEISWVDVNGDSFPDLSVVSAGQGLSIWLNSGSGQFRRAEIPETIATLAVKPGHAWGDIDYDGDQDLCVIGGSAVLLLQNDGNGALAKSGGLPLGQDEAKAVLFVDYDHDGDLDLYLTLATAPPRMWRNDGKGAFSPVPDKIGLSPGGAAASRIVFLDFDEDDDTDFLVARSQGPNLLLSNLRVGTFADVAAKTGADQPGSPRNVIATDLNGDEWRDLVFIDDKGHLTAALGNSSGKFEHLALGQIAGADRALASLDYDNDGDEDLLAGGQLFQNDGRFTDFSSEAGLQVTGVRQGEGDQTGSPFVQAIPEDFDADGDLDLALCMADGSVRLMRNDGGNKNQWLRVQLEGLQSNRFGVATKVEIREGPFFQRKIYEGRPLLFGIGPRRDVDVLRLWWPTGVAQNIVGPKLGQTNQVKEKLGPPSSCPFVYLWDGNGFSFFTDVLDAAALGVPLGDGKLLPHAGKEDLRITGGLVHYREGRIEIRLTGELREIVYLDGVRLSAVDHSVDSEIYPADFAGLAPRDTSSLIELEDARPPLSARNERGEDVGAQLLAQDGQYAVKSIRLTRFNGLAEPHSLILDLGDIASLRRPALLIQGWINWIDGDTLNALGQSGDLAPYGPVLEMQADGGPWHTVSSNIGLPPGLNKQVIAELPRQWAGRDTRLRITTNLELYWDRAAVGNLVDRAKIQTHVLPLLASDLHFRGFSRVVRGKGGVPPWYDYSDVVSSAEWKPQKGYLTRYGDVRPLLRPGDNQLVILGPGDEISLVFDIPGPLPSGLVRDFVLRFDGWIKDANPSTYTGDRVEPLPTSTMKNYPFDPEPDAGNRSYWETIDRYNTRVLDQK